jgi:hypothetical protein
VPLAKQQLGLREVYRQSSVYGATVHTMGPKAESAAREMNALADEIAMVLSPVLSIVDELVLAAE